MEVINSNINFTDNMEEGGGACAPNAYNLNKKIMMIVIKVRKNHARSEVISLRKHALLYL